MKTCHASGSNRDADHVRQLLNELERVDNVIRQAVARVRASQPEAGDDFRGLYVSDADVDAMLAGEYVIAPGFHSADDAADERAAEINNGSKPINQPGDHSDVRQHPPLAPRLSRLVRSFRLSSFEIDVLLIALAPEVDLAYERLYGYLQDDITRRRPTVDLALNLLCSALLAKLTALQHFSPSAPLLNHQLLRLLDDPSDQAPPLLRRYLIVDPRIVSYLFGFDDLDARLLPYARLDESHISLQDVCVQLNIKQRMARIAGTSLASGRPCILYLQGAYGVGKQTTAQAVSREHGRRLLVADGAQLAGLEDAPFADMCRLLLREADLQDAALYWNGFDALLDHDRRARRETFFDQLSRRSGVTFLAGNTTWEPADAPPQLQFVRVAFPFPGAGERARLWSLALSGDAHIHDVMGTEDLAGKFRLSGGQIRDAIATAHSIARWRDPGLDAVTTDDLVAACRLQSNQKLASLARKIVPRSTWADIVLPPDRLHQLREMCSQVQYRARVYDEWGFDRKLSLGKGLNVLFAGPSGTGKTMAAEIIASELGLDLYKIDLATVVSKYIGETEKNLQRIFAEAESSNAILFFDEADALFGKRSEVKDAHDRYANVEIAYLLQRMEEYAGITILATNLRTNVDEAFVRRMHFIIEFPFPGERDRRRIWEIIWPVETPRDPALDLELLARRFEITGGTIRNIAVAASFLAAADGQVVGMEHLFHATKREYQKLGKVAAPEEFEQLAEVERG